MITVFTPAYNRAYRLPTLYESLKRQSCMEFEWIIVDDGSRDNTKELVSGWQAENNPFEIRYFWKENGGKHTAINLGVEKAQTEWFFIVDSDDYVTDDAVQKIHKWIETVEDPNYAAVSGTRCFPNGSIIGQCEISDNSFIDATNIERAKYKLLGDKAEVYKTDVLKKYPFPVFLGERFLTECAVWNHIAIDGYKVRWFKDSIIVCEYLADGLTAQINTTDIEVANFEGCTYTTKIGLRAYTGVERIRLICQYINKARKKGLTYHEISNKINRNIIEILILSIPVYMKNRMKGRT